MKTPIFVVKKVSEIVNLEIDMIARYVYNFINIPDKKSARDRNNEKDMDLKEKMIRIWFHQMKNIFTE